jgi:hypothetical protein
MISIVIDSDFITLVVGLDLVSHFELARFGRL